MSEANAYGVVLQYRRRWELPWVAQHVEVEIGVWKHGIGHVAGSLMLQSYELPTIAGGNTAREVGAAACPLQQGDFVRVVQLDEDGLIPADPLDMIVHWVGWILTKDIDFAGSQPSAGARPGVGIRRITWTCGGLASLLAQIDICRYWGTAGSVNAPAVIEAPFAFSPGRQQNRQHYPDSALTEYQIGAAGKTIPWDALGVLKAIIQWHMLTFTVSGATVTTADRFPRWPVFELVGVTDGLAYQVRDATVTGTVLDAVVALAHPRRGLTFVVEPPIPSAANPSESVKLRILSVLPSPITISIPASEGGGTLVVPESNRQHVGTVTNLPHRSLALSSEGLRRRLKVIGRGATCVCNLRWSRDGSGVENGALTRGWKSADDSRGQESDPKWDDVWRTFHIRSGWDGTVGTNKLATELATIGTSMSPDALHGVAGISGVRNPATLAFPARNVTLLDHLPVPSAAKLSADGTRVDFEDWLSVQTGKTLDYASPGLRPRVFVNDRTANSWRELQVSVAVTGPTTIQLGDSYLDRMKIKNALSHVNMDLVILCAVVEPLPFMVSYEPPADVNPDGLPISADRTRRCPWAELVWIPQDTVFGLTSSSVTVKAAVTVTARDDTAILKQVLALARPIGEKAASCIIADRLSLSDLPAVGTLLTTIGIEEAGTMPVNYIVTERTCDPSPENFGCIIKCEIPELDVEALL